MLIGLLFAEPCIDIGVVKLGARRLDPMGSEVGRVFEASFFGPVVLGVETLTALL